MLNKWIGSSLATCLVLALTACESTTLIELNNDFVSLSQQKEDAEALRDTGTLDAAHLSAIEGYRAAFAETGEKAEAAAAEADKAHLLRHRRAGSIVSKKRACWTATPGGVDGCAI